MASRMAYNIDKVDVLKKPPKLEIIKWLDHVTHDNNRWRDYKEYTDLSPHTIYTVGWVIHEDSQKINIIATSDRDVGQGTGDFCIIKKAILYRWVLKDPSTPKGKK